jgi:hypothetical protein
MSGNNIYINILSLNFSKYMPFAQYKHYDYDNSTVMIYLWGLGKGWPGQGSMKSEARGF